MLFSHVKRSRCYGNIINCAFCNKSQMVCYSIGVYIVKRKLHGHLKIQNFSCSRGNVIFILHHPVFKNKLMSDPTWLTGSHVINLPAKKYPLTVPRLDLNMACKKSKRKYLNHVYLGFSKYRMCISGLLSPVKLNSYFGLAVVSNPLNNFGVC